MCFIMSRPKISVILPVYNVEDYLTETLNSISAQTMIDDIEVIMVDDGSTDESRYIIERYALDYENFHAYHKENEGQGIARNFALKLAEGDYIHFMDSDDYLPPDAYEKLYSIAIKDKPDMVIGNVLRFARYNEWQDILFRNSYADIAETMDDVSLEKMPSLVWDTITCNKLYRREFLLENCIEFPDRKISFEDIPFSLESYILADSISLTPEVWYYWRLRNDHTSTTQQDLEVKSVRDRLEILRMVDSIMDRYDVNENIANEEYLKWTAHDLKFFIKRFDHYPKEHHRELFCEIRELVNLIPGEILEGLNSYRRAIFMTVQNNDFESFKTLAPLEDEIHENPHIPEFLDDEYKAYFDFKKAVRDEELICEVDDVAYDESDACIEFRARLNYLTDESEHDIGAILLDDAGNGQPLEVDDNKIIIPFTLLKNSTHSRVKITYSFGDFKKECVLKNRQRQSINLDGFFLDMNTGRDSHLFIDIMDKCDNLIEIEGIAYDDGQFALRGNSKRRIDEVYIENVISFKKITCPVEYTSGDEFTFTIDENELMNAPVKKWEINCRDCKNSIRVSEPFEFYRMHDKVRFINSRNKILIEDDIYNSLDELNALNNETKDLKSEVSSLKGERSRLTAENKRIEKENAKLNERIEEFKSRKVVKMADKLKLR